MNCLLCLCEKLTVIEVVQGPRRLTYFQCENCALIFLSPVHRLSAEDEKKRYEKHINDVLDQGYQNFVTPLNIEIQSQISNTQSGLDYGSGSNSAIAYLLESKGYHVDRYDPFFKGDQHDLEDKKYDFVIVCEVAEHFYNPGAEFRKIKKLLNPGGRIFILTALKTAEIDFPNWSYRRDPTHVCFFSEKSFHHVADEYELNVIKITKPNLIVLQKRE